MKTDKTLPERDATSAGPDEHDEAVEAVEAGSSAEVDEAVPVDVPDEETAPKPRGLRRWWPAAVVVLALLVMAAGLLSWWHAGHDDDRSLAQRRDAVLIAATAHIETLNTLDYRQVDKGLAAWGAVTTGTLHDQLSQVTDDERKLLGDQKKISVGKVVDAAVFSLSDDTATVVASVEVTVRDGGDTSAAPTVKRNRFSADMVDVHGRWLVESLQQVAVDIS